MSGENCLYMDQDGDLAVKRNPPRETNSAFRDARRILALPDSAITELPQRENGLRTWKVENATVSWPHGTNKKYVCWTHRVNVCVHTRRVLRFMEGK